MIDEERGLLETHENESKVELKILKGNASKEEIQPLERYSSSDVIAAAEELKFKQIIAKKVYKIVKKPYETSAHMYDNENLESNLETCLINGLTNKQAKKRLKKYGLNRLTPRRRKHWCEKLLPYIFVKCFNLLLWICSILLFILYIIYGNVTNLGSGIALAVIAILSGIFVYFLQSKAEDLHYELSAMKPKNVIVIRNGVKAEINPYKLTIGDIVYLTVGMAIPADIRIFECTPNMEVDNSSLTGESEPQTRDWRPSTDIVQEANNMCFFGTLVVNGSGKGVVIKTGDETFMGRTARLATAEQQELFTGYTLMQLRDFLIKIGLFGVILGIVFFIIGMVNNGNIERNIMFLVGVIIGSVPEAILIVLTISMTSIARKMFDKNIRVKHLESIDILAKTTVLLTDKTGVLTTHIMTVTTVVYDLKECICDTTDPCHAVYGDFYQQNNEIRCCDFMKLARCGALCNNACWINNMVDRYSNATEAAILRFSSGHIIAEYRIDINNYRKRHRKLHEIPFNSRNKWQVCIHELPKDMILENDIDIKMNYMDEFDKFCIVQMKGAPERILNFCDRYMFEDKILKLDDDIRSKIMYIVRTLGSRGERVLAFAELVLNPSKYNINIPEPKLEEKFEDDIENIFTEILVFGYVRDCYKYMKIQHLY
eukprot:330171_1